MINEAKEGDHTLPRNGSMQFLQDIYKEKNKINRLTG